MVCTCSRVLCQVAEDRTIRGIWCFNRFFFVGIFITWSLRHDDACKQFTLSTHVHSLEISFTHCQTKCHFFLFIMRCLLLGRRRWCARLHRSKQQRIWSCILWYKTGFFTTYIFTRIFTAPSVFLIECWTCQTRVSLASASSPSTPLLNQCFSQAGHHTHYEESQTPRGPAFPLQSLICGRISASVTKDWADTLHQDENGSRFPPISMAVWYRSIAAWWSTSLFFSLSMSRCRAEIATGTTTLPPPTLPAWLSRFLCMDILIDLMHNSLALILSSYNKNSQFWKSFLFWHSRYTYVSYRWCVCACVCMCVRACLCVSVCACTYTHTHVETLIFDERAAFTNYFARVCMNSSFQKSTKKVYKTDVFRWE